MEGKEFIAIFLEDPHVHHMASVNDISEPYNVRVEVGDDIEVEFRSEGEWFEIPDDPMERVEVPARTCELDIQRAVEAMGAHKVWAEWKMGEPEDPSYRSSNDAVQYYVKATWKVDWVALTKHYGLPILKEQFHKVLPEARAMFAESTKGREEHGALPSKPKRRRGV